MPALLLVAFIAVPLIEIAVFIEVGGLIGLWPTLAIIVATAVAGTMLLRVQGLATLARAQHSLNRQQFPVKEVFDGLCLLLAGALLLTPGFVTDTLGFLLFVPPLRAMLRSALWNYLKSVGRVTVNMDGDGPAGDVIDGDFREVNPDESDDKERRRLNDDKNKRSGTL